jgi:hypothetical protein
MPDSTHASAQEVGGRAISKVTKFLVVVVVLLLGISFGVHKANTTTTVRQLTHADLVYPESAYFDPAPSMCHDTWGCLVFERHPDLQMTAMLRTNASAVAEIGRLKHPTIIRRLAKDPNIHLVSIDGTNEGIAANPRAAHTMAHPGIAPVRPGQTVRVRFVGGALSTFDGERIGWNTGAFVPQQFIGDQYLYTDIPDHWYAEALLVRLATASGRHTHWQKFCNMVSWSAFSQVIQCLDDYKMFLKNELGEDAFVEFFNNSVWLWNSHLAGTPVPVQDFFAKGMGLNGDRLDFEVRYLPLR